MKNHERFLHHLIITALAVSAMAFAALGWAARPTAQRSRHPGRAGKILSPTSLARPAGVPQLKYINPNAPPAKAPEVKGKYEAALVPDTCNLEERARLFVDHFLTQITQAELDHEPFNRGRFRRPTPPDSKKHSIYLCGLPKYREALPLLRMMNGSQKGLEIDKAWASHILKNIGPDGLYYIPRTGAALGRQHQLRPDRLSLLVPAGREDEFYTHLSLGNGRLLGRWRFITR